MHNHKIIPMFLENAWPFAKKTVKIKPILPGNTAFLLLFLTVSISLLLFTVPAFAIRLINVHLLFEIKSEFNKPTDVSVSKNGLIYVVDGVNNKIKVFNRKGLLVAQGNLAHTEGDIRNQVRPGLLIEFGDQRGF